MEPNLVRRTYTHPEYLADRAVMMQLWPDLLDDWVKAARMGAPPYLRQPVTGAMTSPLLNAALL